MVNAGGALGLAFCPPFVLFIACKAGINATLGEATILLCHRA